MENGKLKIGITQGDINGISYEVILKTLAEPRVYEPHAVVIYGSSKVASYHKKNLDLTLNTAIVSSAMDAQYGAVSIVNCTDEEVKVDLGESTPAAGKSSWQALDRAVREMKEGLIDVLVTAPINKHNIQSSEFHFPGHTEYLEQEFGSGHHALMLMACETMRVAVVTGHIPLEEVPSALNQSLILEKIKILDKSLRYDFALDKPRIAVLSLNPHAGDQGLIGRQEQEVIVPAVEEAQKQNICCFGPIAADGFFGSDNYSLYDGILAMYHDQGLIPFKVMSQGHGVNFTAGLPIVRTSPAHGTAYELAGQNRADESSFREALYMACDIFFNRQRYEQMHRNPLRKQHIEQGGDLADLPPVREDEL